MNLRHHSLIAWQRADDLFIKLQRRHRRARLHFLNVSESSLAETSYCLHAARRLGYITKKRFDELERDLNGVGAPLTGLIRSIEESPNEISHVADKPGRRRSSFPSEE